MPVLDIKLVPVHTNTHTEDALPPMPCHSLHDCMAAYTCIGTRSLVHDGVTACRDAGVCAAFWAMVTDYVQTHMESFIEADDLQILSLMCCWCCM